MADLHRRRLFLITNLMFLACLLIGIVLAFAISSVAGKFVVAGCLLVVMVANILLRFTYFKNVLPELREERGRRRFEGWPPSK